MIFFPKLKSRPVKVFAIFGSESNNIIHLLHPPTRLDDFFLFLFPRVRHVYFEDVSPYASLRVQQDLWRNVESEKANGSFDASLQRAVLQY